MPFHGELCVEVGDTSYSKPKYLAANRSYANLVTIVRIRSNRTFYRQPEEGTASSSTAGHPTWYGEPFKLPDPETWHAPEVVSRKLCKRHLQKNIFPGSASEKTA